MDNKTALKIAIEVLKQKCQQYAVEANLFDLHGIDSPGCKAASNSRKRLREVIERLEVIKNGG